MIVLATMNYMKLPLKNWKKNVLVYYKNMMSY